MTINRRSFVQATGSLVALNLASLSAASGADVPVVENPTSSANYPFKFREIEHTWIPMPDGVRLAARIWLPEGAEKKPVPALFNYNPYYNRILMRPEDDARFPYFAGHGYACVRVDIRGSGDSEGWPLDEYVKQEQDDGCEVIKWIADQAWCSGSVGMEGLSWSGFNSLQIAARRPPALKAIITHCSTDDRYANDAHYRGGCIVGDMFWWGTVFLGIQGLPSDPAITGEDGWRKRWLERLDAVDFNLGTWMTHQHKDAFWKHASVNEDYSQITCPVYAIGGWLDGYTNTVGQLLAGLKVPRRGLIGPWTHIYPHNGVPGPAIGYLDEARRWWDHWLKEEKTGIMDEPMLRVWMQHHVPEPDKPEVPGRWVAEDNWPSPSIGNQTFFLSDLGQLTASIGKETRVDLEPLQTVGVASGNWCPSGAGAAEDLRIEMALDQRLDDARSLVFDSAPLDTDLEILGAPEVTLDVVVDRPVAYIVARLNDVQTNGASGRVSYGILNLCQRNSDESPEPLEPGHRYSIRLRLDDAGHRFAAGNRIRLALSTTYWPLIFPSPEPVSLSVFTGSSELTLPIRTASPGDERLRSFGPAFVPAVEIETLSTEPGRRRVEWEVAEKKQVIHHAVGKGAWLLKAIDTQISGYARMRYEIKDDDPTSMIAQYEYVTGFERGNWKPRVVATSKITTTTTHYNVSGELNAFYNGDKIFARVWDLEIKRELV